MSHGARPGFAFASKADTLERLRPDVRKATILPGLKFSVEEWKDSPLGILDGVATRFRGKVVIVRSSAADEDCAASSSAGKYRSVAGVQASDIQAMGTAVREVIGSYGRESGRDQVLIQEMVSGVVAAGVVFTRDLDTMGPYYVYNYDTRSGRTDMVTSGSRPDLQVLVHSRHASCSPKDPLVAKVHEAIVEIEEITGCDGLDVEFAVAASNEVYVLQVRPLSLPTHEKALPDDQTRNTLERVHAMIREMSGPHPYLPGPRSVFGVMPDWNPAEIIGVKPRRLALTMYKELVTDSIWAYQRNNYGYRNLRSFPLLVSLAGMPYIDVRVDFTSFVPADLDERLAGKLVEYYVDRLMRYPGSHDKVEFDVVFSCYTLDLPDRLEPLLKEGFTYWELGEIRSSLRRLTNKIIDPVSGLYREDAARIESLIGRQSAVLGSVLSPVAKIYWLIEDCKRHGTLPFAGLARGAFIAVQFLRSFRSLGIIRPEEYDRYLKTMNTVAKRMAADVRRLRGGKMPRAEFKSIYGHLRPGTYDILSKRYDEALEEYFPEDPASADSSGGPDGDEPGYDFSDRQKDAIDRLLREHGITVSVGGLLRFIRETIEGREYAKFIFTRSLSDALKLIEEMGGELGLSVDDLSYLNLATLLQSYASMPLPELGEVLRTDIEAGRRQYGITRLVRLPPLICDPDDIFSFNLPEGEPNYITLGRAKGEVVFGARLNGNSCSGKIVMIEGADPGYDWIFASRIAGLITMYGGANSHMAIRAAELGIPAVIGCGEKLYKLWSRASVLEIDGAGKQVRVIR